jgi:hypothetical protein
MLHIKNVLGKSGAQPKLFIHQVSWSQVLFERRYRKCGFVFKLVSEGLSRVQRYIDIQIHGNLSYCTP